MKKELTDITEIRVKFSEMDAMLRVWHGNYVKYFEDGRESFGRHYIIQCDGKSMAFGHISKFHSVIFHGFIRSYSVFWPVNLAGIAANFPLDWPSNSPRCAMPAVKPASTTARS